MSKEKEGNNLPISERLAQLSDAELLRIIDEGMKEGMDGLMPELTHKHARRKVRKSNAR